MTPQKHNVSSLGDTHGLRPYAGISAETARITNGINWLPGDNNFRVGLVSVFVVKKQKNVPP
jgi:hypothetical protein